VIHKWQELSHVQLLSACEGKRDTLQAPGFPTWAFSVPITGADTCSVSGEQVGKERTELLFFT
jgi:hypothetical protein